MSGHTRRRGWLVLGVLGVALLAACAPMVSGHQAATLRPALSGERRMLEVAGFGRVAYYADPRGSGRPLLLVHSVNAAGSAYEMKPLWDAYAGTRPVYALELPGFGSSDRPDVRYTPELMTRAITALIGELGTDVDVVALSLGSEFAARAALSKARIRTLALISPSGFGAAQGGTQRATDEDGGKRLYDRLNAFGDPLYALIRSRPSIWYFLSRSFRGSVPGDLIQYGWETSHQPGAKYAPLYFISGQLFTPDAYGTLYSKLTTPTLVLYDKDGFVSFDRLPEFGRRDNVTLKRIPDTDGLPHWEKRADVKAALDAFWAAQASSGAPLR